jgi:hypothetical protein
MVTKLSFSRGGNSRNIPVDDPRGVKIGMLDIAKPFDDDEAELAEKYNLDC